MNDEKETKATKKANAAKGTDTAPVHVVRQGAIAASIWKRQTGTGYSYYDFSLSRSWKSASTERTGYSTNYSDKNEQALIQVIQAASAWIAAQNQNEASDSARESLAA